jgi:hypothetical protein
MRSVVLGAFRAEERWLDTPHPYSAPNVDFTERRPGEDHGDHDHTLGLLLGVIADDIHHFASAACAGIIAEFAARAAHARKYRRGDQLAAALREIAEARKAALAVVRRNAALELAARKQAAIEARRGRRSWLPVPGQRGGTFPTMSRH